MARMKSREAENRELNGQSSEDHVSEGKILYKELSYRVIQACFEVHNVLGPGYSEKIYDEAMAVELKDNAVAIERQKLWKYIIKECSLANIGSTWLRRTRLFLSLRL